MALYEGEVAWVDAQVGRILRSLDALALRETTLVVVVSDHGEEFFDHGNLGHRHTLYEEVVRVPLLLRLPGVLPEGAAISGVVSVSDLLPTLLDILALPREPTPGAASFLPLIHGAADGASPAMLARLVMMFAGSVEIDGTEQIPLRQIMVQDVFRTGSLKITRTRRWPQFPAGLAPDVSADLRAEAAAQYEREQLSWIDVERFPQELPEQHSTNFTDPTVREAIEAFRREYTALVAVRRHHPSPLPENVRLKLESLGYLEADSGPTFPDIVRPPPGRATPVVR